MTQSSVSYEIVDARPMDFLGVSRTTGCSPAEISQGMGEAFEAVWSAMCEKSISPAGPAVAVYHSYDGSHTKWDAGIVVGSKGLEQATGEVKALSTPAGRALKVLHKGPYQELKSTYEAVMARMVAEGIEAAGKSWEVYINDPKTTPPEELLTEINMSIL